MPVERVLLVEPRSFCAGVEMAIKTLAWMVAIHDEPVFCVHEIVHNDAVVRRFERLGVVFVDDARDVPGGAPVVLSAHGSAPEQVAAAHTDDRSVVDAVCPLVKKVHHEIRTRAAAGSAILYVGLRGHDETEAALAVAPQRTTLLAGPGEVDAAGDVLGDGRRPVALLAQTTLSLDRLDAVERAVRGRFSSVWTPRRGDLCYATTNRQRALRAACAIVDGVVVVGSRSSANTAALVAVAREAGRRTVRVDNADQVPSDCSGTVAVTAGASAPDDVVYRVAAALEPRHGAERYAPIAEDAYFPLPRVLHRLVRRALSDGHLDPLLADAFRRDRELDAFAVLERVERMHRVARRSVAVALEPAR